MPENINRLKFEKSPYLLQHKDNPVHWYAWGDEAFQAAKQDNKPIFLSIGYSTCHWCHVMEHESFETQEVAEVLNRDFIAIKVDREERPDVDDIYMSAVHAMKQRGGWPLSMFLTPELKPFFGGTYWPKPQFIAVLQHLAKLWREEPAKVQESGESLLEYLRAQKSAEMEKADLSQEVFRRFYGNSLVNFDRQWGGFGPAPKFPHAMQLSMLLRIYRRTQDEMALQMVNYTLDRMARGGIYDHLGGGFSRYSTDERWLTPHFEKMLYDNALLAVSYLEAFQVTQNNSFAAVAKEILDYVLRDMTEPQGGFYSAEDADSEGEEGKFYVWTYQELKSHLTPEEFERICQVYQVTPQGNFEHASNILSLANEYSWFEKDEASLKSARDKLFKIREARIHPYKDDKILTSWNGLMIRAMALGYRVLGDQRYLQAAHGAADFLKQHLFKDDALLARYRDGEGRFSARLEDYAFLISGLIDLYQCDFRPEDLRWALHLQEIQDRDFWDGAGGAYFFTDGKDPSLLVRGKEGMDGALPNANAMSAMNLLRLHGYSGAAKYQEQGAAIFSAFSSLFSEYPQAFSQMLMAYDYFDESGKELAIVGETSDPVLQDFLVKIRDHFWPNLIFAQASDSSDFPMLLQNRSRLNGQTTFYLCENQSCQAPTAVAAEVLRLATAVVSYPLTR